MLNLIKKNKSNTKRYFFFNTVKLLQNISQFIGRNTCFTKKKVSRKILRPHNEQINNTLLINKYSF